MKFRKTWGSRHFFRFYMTPLCICKKKTMNVEEMWLVLVSSYFLLHSFPISCFFFFASLCASFSPLLKFLLFSLLLGVFRTTTFEYIYIFPYHCFCSPLSIPLEFLHSSPQVVVLGNIFRLLFLDCNSLPPFFLWHSQIFLFYLISSTFFSLFALLKL